MTLCIHVVVAILLVPFHSGQMEKQSGHHGQFSTQGDTEEVGKERWTGYVRLF